MKVSIITATYNSYNTVRDTLKSVSTQTHPDIEHVIIDGGSKDNTLEIVKQFKHPMIVVSERDKGIYDAMNKGVAIASGDIVGILNSDDFYVSEEVISKVARRFEDCRCDILYADINYVDRIDSSKIVRSWISGMYYENYFLDGFIPAHPSVFIRADLARQFPYDLKYKLAADYDFLLRVFFKPGLRINYLNEKVINMRLGGATSKNWRNIFIGNVEIARSWIINRHRLPLCTLLFKRPKIKMKQFI